MPNNTWETTNQIHEAGDKHRAELAKQAAKPAWTPFQLVTYRILAAVAVVVIVLALIALNPPITLIFSSGAILVWVAIWNKITGSV